MLRVASAVLNFLLTASLECETVISEFLFKCLGSHFHYFRILTLQKVPILADECQNYLINI